MPNREPKGVEWMREIGRQGGLKSAQVRFLRQSASQRRMLAMRASRVRWGKAKQSPEEEASYLEGYEKGLQDNSGWPRRDRSRRPIETTADPAGDHADKPAPVRVASNTSNRKEQPDAIESVIDRHQLAAALALDTSPRTAAFLSALIDPRRKKQSLGRLAQKFGVTCYELAAIWRSYQTLKAMLIMVGALPEVAQDIVDDAKSPNVVCPRCDGLRFIAVPEPLQETLGATTVPCPQCGGVGTVRQPGSASDRRIMLDALGIAKGAVTINASVVIGPDNLNIGPDSLDALIDGSELESEQVPPASDGDAG